MSLLAEIPDEGTGNEGSGTATITKATRTNTRRPKDITQSVPNDHDRSLDKLLAYVHWNWGKVRKLGQRQIRESTVSPGPTANTSIGESEAQSVMNPTPPASHNGVSTRIGTASPTDGSNINSIEEPSRIKEPAHIITFRNPQDNYGSQSQEPEQREDFEPRIASMTPPAIRLILGSNVDLDVASEETHTTARVVEANLARPKRPTEHSSNNFDYVPGSSFHSDGTRRRIPNFRSLGENLYQATRMKPDVSYTALFDTKWDQIFRDKIRLLSVDHADLFVLELRMLGSSPRQESMKPTMLIICNETVQQTLRSGLSSLRKEIVPKEIQFVVIGKNVELDSPGRTVPEDFQPRTGLRVELYPAGRGHDTALVGSSARIRPRPSGGPRFAPSTIGGTISVGGSLYALTTAHSLFRLAEESHTSNTTNNGSKSEILSHGTIRFYHWMHETSWTQELAPGWPPKQSSPPMDWVLISLNKIRLPRIGQLTRDRSPGVIDVSGFLETRDFRGVEDVWILGGVTGTQSGVLNSTRATFMFNGAAFDVYSIALEFPLAEGDSGSWVVCQTTRKLCGYVFARISGLEEAYMLPIGPTLSEIRKVASKAQGKTVVVEVPNLETINAMIANGVGTNRQVSSTIANAEQDTIQGLSSEAQSNAQSNAQDALVTSSRNLGIDENQLSSILGDLSGTSPNVTHPVLPRNRALMRYQEQSQRRRTSQDQLLPKIPQSFQERYILPCLLSSVSAIKNCIGSCSISSYSITLHRRQRPRVRQPADPLFLRHLDDWDWDEARDRRSLPLFNESEESDDSSEESLVR
ncbi:hypothetical protein DL98DRAFT_622199 [Cadophora sp. DSE1049]|nr:hypothetical protein DL98DRAFT_622199 [Cadophora sp. DSE1049]